MSPYQCQRVEEMKLKKQHTSSHSLETWFLECFIKDADSILACVNDFMRFFSFNSFVYYRRRWREEEDAKDAAVNKRAARCSTWLTKCWVLCLRNFITWGKLLSGDWPGRALETATIWLETSCEWDCVSVQQSCAISNTARQSNRGQLIIEHFSIVSVSSFYPKAVKSSVA